MKIKLKWLKMQRFAEALQVLAFAGVVTLTISCGVNAQMMGSGLFEVTNTGAGTYTVPIKTPPGVAGVEPKLSLVYNSQGANGLVGMGWNLSGLSSIARCAKNLNKQVVGRAAKVLGGNTYTESDDYCLDGKRLVKVGGEYRTEIEGFSKIVAYSEPGVPAASGAGSFLIKTKNGLVLEYGKTEDSRVEAQGVIDAQGHGPVRIWALNKVADAKGNYYSIKYTENNLGGEYYPTRIDYTANDAAAPALQPEYSLYFDYEARPDLIKKYQAGKLVGHTVRLKKIRVTRDGVSIGSMYKFSYLPERVGRNSSVLGSVQECSSETECLPATSFEWNELPLTQPSVWEKDPDPLKVYGLPSTTPLVQDGVATPGFYFVDLNGDGLVDVVESRCITDKNIRQNVFLNNGQAWVYKVQLALPECLTIDGVEDSGARLIDINGDGRLDLVVSRYINSTTQKKGTWINNLHGWLAQSSLILPEYLAMDGVADTGVRFADLNGDGLPELVMSRYVNASSQKRGVWFFNPTGVWESDASWNLPEYLAIDGIADSGVRLADLNGDGFPDLLQSRYVNATTQFKKTWMNSGKGSWEVNQNYAPMDYFSIDGITKKGFSNNGVDLMDLNGDGLPDLYVDRLSYTARNWPQTATTFSFNYVNEVKAYYRYINAGDRWLTEGANLSNYTNIWPVINRNFGCNVLENGVDNGSRRCIDLNGDGQLDLVASQYQPGRPYLDDIYNSNNSSYLYSGGNVAYGSEAYKLPNYMTEIGVANRGRYLLDLNGDGFPDFMESWSRYDGQTIAYGRGAYINKSRKLLLGSVNIGGQKVIDVAYLPLPQLPANRFARSLGTYPLTSVVPTAYVVADIGVADGLGGLKKASYSYGKLATELGSVRGTLGFGWVQSQDVATGIVTRTNYRQDFPYIGNILSVSRGTDTSNWSNLGSVTYEMLCNNFVDLPTAVCSQGVDKRYFVYVSKIESKSNKDVNSTGGVGVGLPGKRTTFEMDSWGNPSTITEILLNTDDTDSSFSKTTVNVFFNDVSNGNWMLGRLLKSTVTATAP